MKKGIIFAVGLAVWLCGGCADSHEIDERNFVLSLGVDKGTGEEMEVSMGIANPNIEKEGSIGEEIKRGSGITLAKAMKENETNYSRSMYYGHTKTIILSKAALEEEKMLEDIVDTLMRSNDFSLKTIVLCAEGSAKNCIETVQGEDRGDGLYIWDYYKNNATQTENTLRLNLKELEEGVRERETMVIPMIKIEGEKPIIGGGAVFDGEKICGTLTEQEMTGYALAAKNCAGYLLQIETEKATIPVFIKKTSCDVAADNNNINFKIDVTADIRGEGGVRASEDEEIKKVTQSLEEKVAKDVKKTMTAISGMGAKEFYGKIINVEVNGKISGTGVIR